MKYFEIAEYEMLMSSMVFNAVNLVTDRNLTMESIGESEMIPSLFLIQKVLKLWYFNTGRYYICHNEKEWY